MKEIVDYSYKYSDLTGKIIGCAMKVHSALGMVFRKLFTKDAWRLNWKNRGCYFQGN